MMVISRQVSSLFEHRLQNEIINQTTTCNTTTTTTTAAPLFATKTIDRQMTTIETPSGHHPALLSSQLANHWAINAVNLTLLHCKMNTSSQMSKQFQ